MILKFDQASPAFQQSSATALALASQPKVPKVAMHRLTLAWPFRAKSAEPHGVASTLSARSVADASGFVT